MKSTVTSPRQLTITAVNGRRQLPVPVTATDRGLPPPSSLKSSDAARAPVAVGLNVTLTVQLAPAPKVLPQVLVIEKSPAFAPRIAICHKDIYSKSCGAMGASSAVILRRPMRTTINGI